MNPFTSGLCGVFDQQNFGVKVDILVAQIVSNPSIPRFHIVLGVVWHAFPGKYSTIIFVSCGGPGFAPAFSRTVTKICWAGFRRSSLRSYRFHGECLVPLPQGELNIRFWRYEYVLA